MNREKSHLVRRAALTALAALLIGCGQKDGSIQPEARPTATAAVIDSPPPTASLETPPDKPAPVAPVPLRMSADKLALQVFVKESRGPYSALRIFPVGDRMVIAPEGRVLAEGRIVATPGISDVQLKGADRNGGEELKDISEVELLNVVGRYPDEVWLDVSGGWGRVTPRGYADTYAEHEYTYLRQFGTFGRVPEMPVGAWPWSKRRTLAYLGGGRFRLALMNRQKPDPLPRQAAGSSCPVRVDGKAMMALPSGRVAVLGPDCDAGGALALELWGEGSDEESLSKSQVLELPGAPTGKPLAAWVLLHGEVVYAVARYEEQSYLAEVRGGRATEIVAPDSKLGGAHIAADGTLFLAGQNTVYRYDGIADGAAGLTPAALPGGLKVKVQYGLFAESHDHVYWAVAPDRGTVILSTHAAPSPDPVPAASPAPAASAAPSAAASAAVSAAVSAAPSAAPSGSGTAAPGASAVASVAAAALLDAFPALTDACTTPIVVLFPVARATPKDFDFAAARADLKDFPGAAEVKLVELEQGGERFLVAAVKDAKAAAALVAYLVAKNKEAAPKAACFAIPSSAREIR